MIKYYYDCSKHMLTMHDIVCADGVSVEDVTEEKKCGSKLPAQARKRICLVAGTRMQPIHSHSVV